MITLDDNVMSRRRFSRFLASVGMTYVNTPLYGSRRTESLRSVPAAFMHPGLLHSSRDLARMRDGVRLHRQPISAGFGMLHSHPLSQPTYVKAGPYVEIGRNPTAYSREFDRDCNAAYQCALMNCITGDPRYANISIDILNAWSTTLRVVSGADAVLCAALGGFKLVNAAELMRHSDSGWAEKDSKSFGSFLRDLFVPVIYNFAPFANGNWDTAAIKMLMAISIYQNDRDLFERALCYYMFGCGNGRLANYVRPSGQCQESGRGQQHTQLGLGHMGDCCEMAWHQGLDLYGSLDNRLLRGFEYVSRYNLGEDVPFETDTDRTGKYRHDRISPRGSLRPIYEQVYNHYVNRMTLPAPYTQQAVQNLRPEGAAFGADHTGFGTLLYARTPGADTEEAEAVGIPSGVYAIAGERGIELDFVPLARRTYYTIRRAQPGSSGFTVLTDNRTISKYEDATVTPSRVYTYQVSAVNSPQGSRPVIEMAGLPAGWQRSILGKVPGDIVAAFDGVSFRMRAAGTSRTAASLEGLSVHRSVGEHAIFEARVVPPIASQFSQLGMVVLGEGDAFLPELALLLLPRGDVERREWSASLVDAGKPGTEPRVIREVVLTAPTVTYGRLVEPLWFRCELGRTLLRASISRDDSSWLELGAAALSRHDLHVGLLVTSGIEDVSTEICFDHVSVRSGNRRTRSASQ